MFIILSISSTIAQAAPEKLTLEQAIERGLQNNREAKLAQLTYESSEITYNTAWHTMFMPNVSFALASSSAYTLAQISGTPAASAGVSGKSFGYPNSGAVLSLGSYTLYNFGKDRLSYESSRLTYDRARLMLKETLRSVRHQIINAYYSLQTTEDTLEAARRSMEISQAILNVVKSRKRIGRANEEAISSALVDLINSKKVVNARLTSSRKALWELNNLLGDQIGTLYETTSKLIYAPLKMDYATAIQVFLKNSPTLRTAILSAKTSQLTYELAQRNRLPVPTLSFSGVTFTYSNGYYTNGNELATNAARTSGNIDVGVSLSLEIPIWGPGGIFKSREVRSAEISKESAEISYESAQISGRFQISSAIQDIREQESNVQLLQESFQRNSAILDQLVQQLSARKDVNRLELRDALTVARDSEIDLKTYIKQHLASKLSLALLMGVDSLPGDTY